MSALLKPNLWTYNSAKISGHNLEVSSFKPLLLKGGGWGGDSNEENSSDFFPSHIQELVSLVGYHTKAEFLDVIGQKIILPALNANIIYRRTRSRATRWFLLNFSCGLKAPRGAGFELPVCLAGSWKMNTGRKGQDRAGTGWRTAKRRRCR